MVGYENAQKIIESAQQPFSIIEEFAALSPKRKMLLFDQMLSDSFEAFASTVSLLWPEASSRDVKKLGKFMKALRSKSAH